MIIVTILKHNKPFLYLPKNVKINYSNSLLSGTNIQLNGMVIDFH
jgi:hypothetical protein